LQALPDLGRARIAELSLLASLQRHSIHRRAAARGLHLWMGLKRFVSARHPSRWLGGEFGGGRSGSRPGEAGPTSTVCAAETTAWRNSY